MKKPNTDIEILAAAGEIMAQLIQAAAFREAVLATRQNKAERRAWEAASGRFHEAIRAAGLDEEYEAAHLRLTSGAAA